MLDIIFVKTKLESELKGCSPLGFELAIAECSEDGIADRFVDGSSLGFKLGIDEGWEDGSS